MIEGGAARCVCGWTSGFVPRPDGSGALDLGLSHFLRLTGVHLTGECSKQTLRWKAYEWSPLVLALAEFFRKAAWDTFANSA